MKPAVSPHLGEAQRQKPDLDLDPELEGFSAVSSSAQKYGAWACPQKGAAVFWSQFCAVCGSQELGG